MTCIFCNQEVTEDKFMLAIERPYLNLYVHKACYKNSMDSIQQFLEENLEKYLKTVNKQKK